MYFTCSLSKTIVLVYFFATKLLLTLGISSLNLTNTYLVHKCDNGKIYKSRGQFEKNLKSSIDGISDYNFKNGFIHTTHNDPPNSATIIFGCRFDSYGPKCRSCFATALAELRRKCARDGVGTIWYDQCIVKIHGGDRYLDKSDYKNPVSFHNREYMSGDTKLFSKNTEDFLHKLMREALRIQEDTKFPINYAMGDKRLGTNKLYAMVQCLQTASEVLCKDCLESSIRLLSKCCDGRRGARVLSTVCNLRYELYPFFRPQMTV